MYENKWKNWPIREHVTYAKLIQPIMEYIIVNKYSACSQESISIMCNYDMNLLHPWVDCSHSHSKSTKLI